MKILFDFFPLILFFAAYKYYDLYTATVVAIAAAAVQVVIEWIRHRKVNNTTWINLAVLALFGGATLYFHDEEFIKWKPTVVNWLFAVVILMFPLFKKKTLVEIFFGQHFELPARQWQNLNRVWGAFFFFLGVLNILVARNFDTDDWVNFKVFGMLGITIVFFVGQAMYLSRISSDQRRN